MDLLFTLKKEEEKADYGRFVIEPLEQGYGHTLGTTLRRVLLTSLEGCAITSVVIEKVRHPFSSIPGVKEDVMELLLNFKKIRIKHKSTGSVKLTLEKSGKGVVKAGDLKAPADVEIINPELPLATLADKSSKLDATFTVETGTGYSPADERRSGSVGVIPLDAIFSPVVRVNYKVEATRVGRLTNYDKLIIELWTDGTISPLEAVKKAAEILVAYYTQIINPKVKAKEEVVEQLSIKSSVANLSVEELNLPARIANALLRGGYETVGQLLTATSADLSRVRNLGEKSVKVISAALGEHGVQFPAQ
ncbi:DNA-directed RNA polymerase subunit alpha [Candidatus Microgenomates bacterium]|nr:DNA-directed RNA polymerase subunit alpha [Candidatus Microgenomates bacterium]